MNFYEEALKLNIKLDEDMLKKYDIYYDFLVKYNENVNLTAITEHDDVFIKHFYDSLTLSKALPSGKVKLCDVGAGAGFPSVPVAISNNLLDVTIIDALNKRIVFLNELVNKLGIKNVKAIHSRAEDYAKNNFEGFDVVTGRAVARLNILAELCLPLVKVGGLFIAMKSREGILELDEARGAIAILGGKVVDVIDLTLPYDMGERQIIIIKKEKSCAKKYPRQFSVIKNKPLK